jgi:hypothetical protein
MMRLTHLASLPVLLVLTATGCTQQGDEAEELLDAQELASFREEVTEALDEIQAELSEMQSQIAPLAEDSWNSLTSTTERATTEMRADLDRLATATAEEARAIQRAAAERLAELEAEMTRTEISSATSADSLVATANSRLLSLESDINTIAERSMVPPEDATMEGEMATAHDDALDLQVRVAEIRANLTEVAPEEAEEAFVATREEIGSDIADLTQDVRKKWYEQQWGLES